MRGADLVIVDSIPGSTCLILKYAEQLERSIDILRKRFYKKDRDKFNCIFCGVQVKFTRKKDHSDPHF